MTITSRNLKNIIVARSTETSKTKKEKGWYIDPKDSELLLSSL